MKTKPNRARGVSAIGEHRIRFDFRIEGVRYRPSLLLHPTEGNLRRAHAQLAAIKERIAAGTFSFADQFPDFRDLKHLRGGGAPTVCDGVFDAFLVHCESRVAKNDLAPITLTTYRRILDHFWRPKLGTLPFLGVRYSTLTRIADEAPWSKKTYNNAVSILRRAFNFGYRDHPDRHNPAALLESAHIRKKDRAPIDPFSIRDAEMLIAAIHLDWGEAQGNYDEFRFFTGLRPSEEIALRVTDLDLTRGGLLKVTKARVAGIERDSTKTGEDRYIKLSSRALTIARRQIALRETLVRQGRIYHDYLFFKANGQPIVNLQYVQSRWRTTLLRLPHIRYRTPYCARHSSISWHLMIGHSPLWVAQQHGHSIETMLRVYAAWTQGATEADLALMERALLATPRRGFNKERERFPPPHAPRAWALDWSLEGAANDASVGMLRRYLAEREGFEPSKGF